jgi:hypothetical protein
MAWRNASRGFVTSKDSHRYYMVALSASNGSGKARAKGADEQGNKDPQQGVRERFASSFR